MKFSELATYLDRLEDTSSRIEITKILASLFHKLSVEETDKAIYLILGVLAPKYKGVVFNVAEKIMIQVVALAYEKEPTEVKLEYKSVGDLGDVAYKFSKKNSSELSISEVHNSLLTLAEDEGEGSQERKIESLAKLLKKLDRSSAKYVTRIPVGRLRLGFSDKTILDGLSWAVTGDKSAKKKLSSAYEVMPDVGLLARNVKKYGVEKATENITPVIGIPVMPMLAQRLKSADNMIEKMDEVAVEPKFDGVRVLIHFKKEKGKDFVKAFTRNMNDVTEMFPELEKIGKHLNAKSVILDTEGVGIDPKTQRMVDFQKTMQRKRKNEIRKAAEDIPFRFQVFDILEKNGKSLMGKEYVDRREELDKTIKKNKLLVIDEYIVTRSANTIRQEHKRLVSEGLEGVIVKKLDATYVPGRTGWRWVKMKEAEEAHAKLADTLDCVILGYTQGRGKRAEFGIGQFLAGVRDGDKIKSITKVGTGLSDDQLIALAKRLKKLEVEEKPKEYGDPHRDHKPDFWIKPEVVVELAADEISKSPKHTSGYALRFPRLIKFRNDKGPDQATTVGEVKKLFKLQRI